MKTLQIIPAQPGWYLTSSSGSPKPVMCWALADNGNGDRVVVPVVPEDDSPDTVAHQLEPGQKLLSPDESYEYSLWAADSWREGLKEGWILHSISAAESGTDTRGDGKPDTDADITVAMKRPIGRS